MTDNYEKYEKECKRIREKNKRLLSEFEEWLGRLERYDDPSITDPEDLWGR